MTFYNYLYIHYLIGNYNYATQQMLTHIQNYCVKIGKRVCKAEN